MLAFSDCSVNRVWYSIFFFILKWFVMKKITTAYLNDHSSPKQSIAPLCYSPTYIKANPYAKHPTMPPFCVQIEEWNCLPALSTRLTILSDRCFWWSKSLFHPLLVSDMQVFSSLFNIFLHHYLSLDAAWPAWPNANERNIWRWWFERGQPRTLP